MVCESYNTSWVVINYCRLKVIKRNTIAAYCNASVLLPANDISVHFQVFKKANGYKPWVMNGKVDICRFLRHPYNPTAMLIGSLFLEFTNFNHTCPYFGTQLVDGFYLRPELLKLPFPTGEYKLYLGWHFDKRLQFETNASFTFIEDLINQ
ncbi:uncharacterized protein Dwil_GK28108 [Drosophila willistoni]|uniref:MD-2-related lipid-recognition domain-containing protein n=1 Tax=Drosophila willistoni TaxID=7260 RepID=A0A0Q9X4Y8_DROWI|nr:uncharacterized protein Dwil_GK28108 [Drosophila willistoni]